MSTAPSAATNPALATGVLAEVRDGAIVLSIPDTDYRILLIGAPPAGATIGQRISGVIHVQARRIDGIKSGGTFVEPIEGRPRRIQGRVASIDSSAKTLTLRAGVPVIVKTNGVQKASQFQPGTMVTLESEPGATFTPA